MFVYTKKGSGQILGYSKKLQLFSIVNGFQVHEIDINKAQGVYINGKEYNIGNTEKIPGAEFAEWLEVKDDDIIMDVRQTTEEQTDYIESLQNIILDQDNYNAILEEAVTELDNQINNE